jgi:hypothetical protein
MSDDWVKWLVVAWFLFCGGGILYYLLVALSAGAAATY